MRHLFCVENIDRCVANWLLGTKMCNLDPKIWIFGAKSQFFCFGIAIFVNSAYHQYTRFRAMGHFLGLIPVFGRFGLVSVHKYKFTEYTFILEKIHKTMPKGR